MAADPKLEEVFTRERCWVTELLNDEETPAVSLARIRVEPGVTTERHRLSVNEWYVIESGEGLVQLGDAGPYRVTAGDRVPIPAGTPQRISNPATAEDLVFLAVCLPRFTPACYTPL